jgi:probable rRNA maturation factor
MNRIAISNRQRTRKVNIAALRRVARVLLEECFAEYDSTLAIHLVAGEEMARINKRFLDHEGSTDVITFDYTEGAPEVPLQGEIFICVDEAITYARQFRCTWQLEIIRYLVHGLLHLQQFDDVAPKKRRIMKREENRILTMISSKIPAASIGKTTSNT